MFQRASRSYLTDRTGIASCIIHLTSEIADQAGTFTFVSLTCYLVAGSLGLAGIWQIDGPEHTEALGTRPLAVSYPGTIIYSPRETGRAWLGLPRSHYGRCPGPRGTILTYVSFLGDDSGA